MDILGLKVYQDIVELAEHLDSQDILAIQVLWELPDSPGFRDSKEFLDIQEMKEFLVTLDSVVIQVNMDIQASQVIQESKVSRVTLESQGIRGFLDIADRAASQEVRVCLAIREWRE